MRRNKLTVRELEILKLVSAGYEYKEVARQLEIKTTTVQNTMTRVILKLVAPNRTSAVTIALKRHEISLEQIPEYE